ncbi:hypothetical protein ZIOFF_004309 [Zingiber officinale]|uniref:Small ribosomal subunit protein uS17 N-terminal domain-containing protein n=1 Tax=Zingiber officinale TaxID=94328 RepID=A0A8J5HYY0_ZINOF|nr:hypothetical protein ZIOFF_004309 [Zingiber officinale]
MDTFSRDTHAFSSLVHLFVYWRIKICARAEENLDSPPPFPSSAKPKRIMSSKQGGKLKPLKQPKADKKDYDEALKELRAKASQKGSFGGSGFTVGAADALLPFSLHLISLSVGHHGGAEYSFSRIANYQISGFSVLIDHGHRIRRFESKECTEKAFLKQPKVFLSSKKSGKGKKPGKGGNRFWKNIGLGFKTPREAIEGTYIDKKCPFTGTVSIRGRILAGTCHSAKMNRTIIVRRNYLHYVKKYQRYEKRHSNIPAHISPCFRVKEGDHVIIGQCRPLSKTVRFNVLKVIPAGSTSGGKKAFVAA